MSGAGNETRELLIETALRLFREQGFQATTMRRIASEAGVSPGNAYYYFAGKDELVHELYIAIQREHRDRVLLQLHDDAPLADNLRVVLHSGLDVMAPYHGFGTSFVQIALPASARTSPFSVEASVARNMAIDLMRQVVERSHQRPPGALREQLPSLLWLAYLGITLHWVIDSSPGQQRTRTLVDGVTPIIAKTIGLARLPFARSVVEDVVTLMTGLGRTSQAVAQ